MVISNIAQDIVGGALRGVGSLKDGVEETLFEPVIRLGVTGLSRSGKTVFITSLIANLMNTGRMPQFLPSGQIEAAYLQPHPNDKIPRFDFEAHYGAITGPKPHWPESTRAVSELRLSFRMRPRGLLKSVKSPRTIHLDIIDYPGEWLLDLGLLDLSYEEWSQKALKKARERGLAEDFINQLQSAKPDEAFDEASARALAQSFTAYLKRSNQAGHSDCSPGRFILPGDLEGSPILTFAPLEGAQNIRKSLFREFKRRFEAYKRELVKPFFRDHFARIDRQIVLIDALGAMSNGPRAVEDLRHTMEEILLAFKPGHVGKFLQILGLKRVEKILFAASKVDHLHHLEHDKLSAIMQALVHDAMRRAHFSGAQSEAMALASLRTTVETEIEHEGEWLKCVKGATPSGAQAAFYAGELPEDPLHLLGPAKKGESSWDENAYQAMQFQPAELTLQPNEGPPHIRLDRAAQFLIGDKL